MNRWLITVFAAATLWLGYKVYHLDSSRARAPRPADLQYFSDIAGRLERDCPLGPTTKVLVAFGQSNAANSVDEKSADTTGHIFNWFAGHCYIAKDPLLGATGDGGNIWIGVATDLLRNHFADDIVIVSLAVGATSVGDWQAGKAAAKHLEKNLQTLSQAQLSVDYFLWVQGERDTEMEESEYTYLISQVVDQALGRFPSARFGISGTSYCFGRSNTQVVSAQTNAAKMNPGTFFLGNTDQFHSATERHDDCHFSSAGARKVSTLFARSIENAAR